MKALLAVCLCCLPLKILKVNSGYGYRLHPLTGKYTMHYGIDLKACHDTVFAILDGEVGSADYGPQLGLNIRLIHGDLESVYGHLSQTMVGPGDSVLAGQPIAITGATGRVTGEHLHFSIRYRHRYIDPLKFFNQLNK